MTVKELEAMVSMTRNNIRPRSAVGKSSPRPGAGKTACGAGDRPNRPGPGAAGLPGAAGKWDQLRRLGSQALAG